MTGPSKSSPAVDLLLSPVTGAVLGLCRRSTTGV